MTNKTRQAQKNWKLSVIIHMFEWVGFLKEFENVSLIYILLSI